MKLLLTQNIELDSLPDSAMANSIISSTDVIPGVKPPNVSQNKLRTLKCGKYYKEMQKCTAVVLKLWRKAKFNQVILKN